MNEEIKEMLEQMKRIEITGKDKNGIKVDGYGLEQNGLKILLDYITNLQQENQEMKTNTIPTLEHNINALVDEVDELEDYKSRCEKAIEYIQKNAEEYLSVDMYYHLNDIPEINDLLNILQNGSDSQC